MILITICLMGTVNAGNITEINSLVNNMSKFNGQIVTIEGEAIGEAMNRGTYSWLNVNDGTNAIGIWLPTSDAERITNFGAYKHKGDMVRISGIFLKNSSEHGSDIEIDCSSLEIIKKGYTIDEEITNVKIVTATMLFSIVLMVIYIYFSVVKKTKNTGE
jgi:aspartyl/asparaginyl-tRNA synthetase